jgi:hypothetical protein
MRLGLLARADNTGLGYQTRSYYKWLKPEKTILIDLSPLNGNDQHYEWYENPVIVRGIPQNHQLRDLLTGIDVLLTAETPYNLNLYAVAKEMGVKTVCVENPEFYDHIKYPDYEMPDLIILPSNWLEKEITLHARSKGTKVVQLHHPVDREDIPFRLRTTKKFIHIAGKPAANDRNGTWDFMQVCPDGVVTTQNNDLARQIRMRYRHCNVFTNIADYKTLYDMGDILVLPRKYGGNCLPLNEALAAGMPVIMPDIVPNNNLLPKEWLVPAYVAGSFEPRTRVDIYQTNLQSLATKIDWFKNCDIQVESEKANKLADTISWTTMLPKYREVLESL